MNCARARRLLGIYRDLERAERRALAQHLRGCEACRGHWEDERRVRQLVRAVPLLAPPPGLEGRLLAIPAARPRWELPRAVPWLILAGGLLLAGTIAWPGPSGAVREGPSGPQAAAGPAAAATAVARRRAPEAQPPPVAEKPRPAEQTDRAQMVALRAQPGRPAPAAPGAAPLEAAAAGGGGRGAATSPAPAGHAAGADGGDEAGGRRGSRPQPTTVPPPEPTACVSLTLTAFADLAGEGGRDCPGCDGRWDEADAAAAAALGLALPPLQVALLLPPERGGELVDELMLEPDGAIGTLSYAYCGALPLRAQLKDGGGAWTACSAAGGPEQRFEPGGPTTVQFALTRGCPAPGASSPTPPPSPPPTPVDPATTVPLTPPEPTPSPSPGAQAAPAGTPTP